MDFEKVLNLGVEKNIIDEAQKNGLIELFNQNSNEPQQISTVVKVFPNGYNIPLTLPPL